MSLPSPFTLLSLALIILAPSATSLLPVVNFSQAATTPVPDTTAHQNTRAAPAAGGPTLNDPDLTVKQIFKGLVRPTSIAFLGPNDILALEKDKGTVQRIVDGKMLPEPVLDVNVANLNERGLLGIAVAKHNENRTTYVFLYYTESGEGKDGDDAATSGGVEPVGNRLYRYDFANDKLINPKLLLDLPASPPPQIATTEKSHNGGKVVIGPVDQNVYVGIGDVGKHRTLSENNANGIEADGTGGILTVTQDGQAVGDSPLGDMGFLKYYYAYGIRNTFGMDFDPVTGKLWDTEDGPTYGDEINLVEPGFDSGWAKIQGLAKDHLAGKADPVADLVNFDGKGVYHDPEFVWSQPIGITALEFLNSDNLGKQYKDTMFIGDVDTGNLYNFKLNPQRTGLLLDGDNGPLADKVANTPDEIEQGGIIFGKGFGVITDIQVNPYDGNLYVLTLTGSIYRVSSSDG
jgi:aldose sugar dehydrogenase